MHTQLNCETVYTLTHSELVQAFYNWSVKASEENWEDPQGLPEDIAAESAGTLVHFLNQ